jgi:hypothetical protein
MEFAASLYEFNSKSFSCTLCSGHQVSRPFRRGSYKSRAFGKYVDADDFRDLGAAARAAHNGSAVARRFTLAVHPDAAP